MRAYLTSDEEALRAREFVKEWEGDEAITKEQREVLDQETVTDLHTTNIFLRLTLFVFTALVVGAGVGLFFEIFLSHPSEQTVGIVFLFFAVACYAAAEMAVSQGRLYQYGIEEALVVVSVGLLCAGLGILLFNNNFYSSQTHATLSLVPAIGAVASLWIWYRFNLWYGFLAGMIFVCGVAILWTPSQTLRIVDIVAFYAAGLVCVIVVAQRHRGDYLESAYSLAEALLWLGVYMALNLKISPLGLVDHLWAVSTRPSAELTRPFYWATWVLIWCLPPLVLTRGIRQKNRLVLATGGVVAVLTLVSNKPYLGWQRHTWDPMLLGVALCGLVWFLRRWLAAGPDGVRSGFTAERLTGTDQRWLQRGSGAFGFVAPHLVTPGPQAHASDFEFGGGTSDGGGASGDF